MERVGDNSELAANRIIELYTDYGSAAGGGLGIVQHKAPFSRNTPGTEIFYGADTGQIGRNGEGTQKVFWKLLRIENLDVLASSRLRTLSVQYRDLVYINRNFLSFLCALLAQIVASPGITHVTLTDDEALHLHGDGGYNRNGSRMQLTESGEYDDQTEYITGKSRNLYPSPHPTQGMVLKLYFAPLLGPSGGACTVAFVLAEKQIPFEAVPLQFLKREHKSGAHLAKQPFGQVPVIDDNGFILYETRAICRYLVEKYPEKGPRLLPGPSLEEQALFEQAASVEFANFFSVLIGIRTELVMKPQLGLDIDQVTLDRLQVQLAVMLHFYEKVLSKQTYLAGNDLTLVDVFHLIPIAIIRNLGQEIMTTDFRPNVARWWNSLTRRTAWLQLEEEGIRSSTKVLSELMP
ncbi:hypothetical protein MIND_01257700 [Mycena indigotica]|uniref:glutathione transferase n=1 Tax=Mycena indigotica TaxID=2126181 RepID=A0A8H6S4G8_9AGAR|nr:uncharacterized protein MIND_01257700 [Mycena indigotica]KAF7291145.1 hypothetical protein MIND_01257700 [Mycena indigotica]